MTEPFLAAVDAKQGAVGCGVLAADTRKSLESEESKPCPTASARSRSRAARWCTSTVAMTSAKVDLAEGETFFLSEEASGWRISALGCRPQRLAHLHPVRLRAAGLDEVLFPLYAGVIVELLVLFLIIGFLGL